MKATFARSTNSKPGEISEGPNPVDIYVGSRLRLRRNIVGFSQEQLGKASGLTFQQIQKYERGINRMGASRLHQMAQILSVQVAYFFDELPQQPANSQTGMGDRKQSALEGAPSDSVLADAEILQRRETLELIRAYYKITDPKQRRKVYELVKSMSDAQTK